MRWLPLPRPYTRSNAEWFIGTFGPGLRESGAGIVFAIESAGRLAGVIDLKHVSWAAKLAEVGYWVAPWARGRGVASGATRALALWAIGSHGFERVELFAATGNAASQRAAEKAGFVREGVARNAATSMTAAWTWLSSRWSRMTCGCQMSKTSKVIACSTPIAFPPPPRIMPNKSRGDG